MPSPSRQFVVTKALLVALRADDERSPRAQWLAERHLELNPSDYSVWAFRFDCLVASGKLPGCGSTPQWRCQVPYESVEVKTVDADAGDDEEDDMQDDADVEAGVAMSA